MPPKRSATQLRALADDPVGGWLQTPFASHANQGFLSGPYLAAYLRHHSMPVTKEAVDRMSGARLWRSAEPRLPAEGRDGSKLFPRGIEALARIFNHGFSASIEAQSKLVAFLDCLPGDLCGEVSAQLRTHYELCNSFRLREDELASPPSYLDLFKDDRVPTAFSRAS